MSKDIVEQAKEHICIFERPSQSVSIALLEEVERLRKENEQLYTALSLIGDGVLDAASLSWGVHLIFADDDFSKLVPVVKIDDVDDILRAHLDKTIPKLVLDMAERKNTA